MFFIFKLMVGITYGLVSILTSKNLWKNGKPLTITQIVYRLFQKITRQLPQRNNFRQRQIFSFSPYCSLSNDFAQIKTCKNQFNNMAKNWQKLEEAVVVRCNNYGNCCSLSPFIPIRHSKCGVIYVPSLCYTAFATQRF